MKFNGILSSVCKVTPDTLIIDWGRANRKSEKFQLATIWVDAGGTDNADR